MMSRISGKSLMLDIFQFAIIYLFLLFIIAAKPNKSSKQAKPLESHFKTDEASGRLHFAEEGRGDKMDTDAGGDSMGAYLEAMRGEDGHTLNAKGKARFNKTQGKRGRGDFEEDEGIVTEGLKELDVGGSGRRDKKKVKKEVTKIGGEFKAKVKTFFFMRFI